MEQQKRNVPLDSQPASLIPATVETAPDSTELLGRIENALGGKIRVTHGAHDCEFESLAGKSVAAVRKSLGSVFSIPKDAQPYIKGHVVDETHKLAEGEQLEFLKESGTKGSS